MQYPFIKEFDTEKEWVDFFPKYVMMTRECMAQAMRNLARQRRQSKHLFTDLNILINEGNYADEVILETNKIEPRPGTTVCL